MRLILSDAYYLSEIILSKIENNGIQKIYISENFYWGVFFDDASRNKRKPKLTVGSLVDDWDWLKKVSSKEYYITNIDLYRLGNVIIAIGRDLYKSGSLLSVYDGILVEIADIKYLLNLIFTKAHKASITEVSVHSSRYWCVALNCIYDFSKEPQIFFRPYLIKIERTCNSLPLTIEDFEQLGTCIKVIGAAINPLKQSGAIFWFSE